MLNIDDRNAPLVLDRIKETNKNMRQRERAEGDKQRAQRRGKENFILNIDCKKYGAKYDCHGNDRSSTSGECGQ